MLKALEFLGAPLPKDLDKSVKKAVEDQDARELQVLLDDRVTFVVNINPESRVKVAEGPYVPRLQQAGWTPLLVKIENDAKAKNKLTATSPQSGFVYGGQGRNENTRVSG